MTKHSTIRAAARYDDRQFLGRVFVGTALALGACLVPAAGPNRFVLAVILAGVVVPAHFVIRWLARVPNPTGPLELLAVLAGSVCSLIEPTVWTTALVFQALTIAASVSYQRPRWIAASSVASLATMSIAAWRHDIAGSVPTLIMFAVFVPVLLTGAVRVRAGERRATSRMRAAVEGLPIMVWEAEATTGRLLAVVGRMPTLLGRTRTEVLETPFLDAVHPDDQHLHWSRIEQRGMLGASYRYIRPDGTIVWLRDQVSVEMDARGPIVRGVSIDVTATHAQEIQLLQHEQIVERMAAATIVLHATGRGEQRIAHVVDPIGLGVGGTAGRMFSEVFPDLAIDPTVLAAVSHSSGVERLGPLQLLHPTERFVELEVFPISADGTAVLISDVTGRELAARTIRRQAHVDELTGLANRVTLMQTLTEATDSGKPIAMLLIDLNRFKEVNDTLGHLSGDEFLRTLGRRLDDLARQHGHSVARLGGDEFAFVVAHESNDQVAAFAERVIDLCRQPVDVLGSAVASGASVGIALAPADARTPEALMRCADLAMYRAKSSRMGAWWYDPSLDRRSDDIETLGRLPAALRDGEFEMYFQPVVHLPTGRVTGCEALARWNHPTRGVLAPDAFLDLVGVAGLTSTLTSIAIEQATAAMQRLGRGITVSINLSAHDLRNTGLAAEFMAAIERNGVSPRKLVIELTEEHLLDPTGVVSTTLHELAAIGVWLAVDDFGTGYSSLTHLRSLPLSVLKIDREFVTGVIDEEHDAVIVRAVTDLAHNLGLSVTAEGVENEAVAAELKRLGCDYAQGYLWARPMRLEDLLGSGLITPRIQPAAAANP